MRKRTALTAIVASVVLLAGVAVFVVVQDPNRYRGEMAELLSDLAGYPVELEGPLTLRWRPTPSLSAEHARISAPGAHVSLDSVRVTLAPGSLLTRRFRVRHVIVDGLVLDLRPGDEGAGPPVFPEPAELPVDSVEVLNVTVLQSGKLVATLHRAAMDQPESPEGARIALRAPVGDAIYEGSLRLRTAPGRFMFDALELQTPAGLVAGSLELALDVPRPTLTGKLRAESFTVPRAADSARRSPLFPRVPVPLQTLLPVDASLNVQVGQLTLGEIQVSELELPVTLRNGRLETHGSGVLATGRARAVLMVDAPEQRWSLEANLEQADAGGVLAMAGADGAQPGGRLDIRARLEATGSDTGAILASLGGTLALDASQVRMEAGSARVAASDVFASVFRAISGEDSERIHIGCAVMRFEASQGILATEEGIGIQSQSVNVLGGGTISLPSERLDLGLRPWPREGLGLSASAVVGGVAISGPLSEPEVGLTSEAAWRSGVTAGAALLTSGLSILAQGLLERARGDRPCQQAAGTRTASRQATPSRDSGAPGRDSGAPGRDSDTSGGIDNSREDLSGNGRGVDDDDDSGRADR